MDFDEILVKENPGLCRCCLSEGCYKDLSTEYSWMSDTEIYADMLFECFDISISQHPEGPNGPNRLICEVCITRLRDACNFKKQVLDSEKKFVDMMAKGDFHSNKALLYQPQMKAEMTEIEVDPDQEHVDFLDDDMDYEDVKTDDPSISGDITVAALPVKNKRGRPRKSATVVKSEKKSKLPKTEDKARGSKGVAKEIKRESLSEESAAVRKRRNLVILFNNTSVVPFKWRGKFACFFCGENYSDHPAFVKHSKSHGHCSVKHASLKNQKSSGAEVKLDVSYISCDLCNETFFNLDQIIDHLIATHNLDYDKEVPMYLALYSLADMKCCECGQTFEFFRHLVTHVNDDHSEKSLLCKTCGKSFNKSRDLAAHIRHYHRRGFNCTKCHLSFDNITLLRAHSKVKPQKTSCTVCKKSFSSYCIKQRHMNTAHCADDDEDNKPLSLIHDLSNEFYEGNIMAAHKQLMESKALAKRNRINVSCILNNTTAIPFKYYQSRFTCFYCSKDFFDHEDMRQHTLMEHPFCDIEKKFPKVLKGVNIYVKLDITTLSCRICFQPFDDLDPLIDHLIDVHQASYDKSIKGIMQPFRLEKYNMICPICHEAFNYFNILLKHMNQEHSGKSHLCAHCGSTFGNESILALHITRSHSENVFKCKDCGSEQSTLLKLKSHRAKVHGERVVNCRLCTEKFPSEYEKQKHLIQVHNIGHKCTYCDRMFVKNSFMRNHIRRTHMKEKKVQCTVCNEKFFDNFMLRLHMVKHTGARDFHCDVCGKSFFWKKNLRVHMNSHNKKANLAVPM